MGSAGEIWSIYSLFYTAMVQGKMRVQRVFISYGIIKNYAGIIDVNSIIDVGTTVVILLPLIDQLEQQEEKSVTVQASMAAERSLSEGVG